MLSDSIARLGVLPDPYPVPGKPFNILFSAYGGTLPRIEVRGCLSQAYNRVMERIKLGGGGHPIDYQHDFRQTYLNVVFRILVGPDSERVLTYNDAKEVLNAFWLKSTEDGYRSWTGLVRSDSDGYPLGGGELRRIPQSQRLSTRATANM